MKKLFFITCTIMLTVFSALAQVSDSIKVINYECDFMVISDFKLGKTTEINNGGLYNVTLDKSLSRITIGIGDLKNVIIFNYEEEYSVGGTTYYKLKKDVTDPLIQISYKNGHYIVLYMNETQIVITNKNTYIQLKKLEENNK